VTKYTRTDQPTGLEMRLLDWLDASPGLSRYGNRIRVSVNLPARTAAVLHVMLIEKCIGALVSEMISQILMPLTDSLSFDGDAVSFQSDQVLLGLCQSHRFLTVDEAQEHGYTCTDYGQLNIAVVDTEIRGRSIGVLRSQHGWIIGDPDSQEWIVAKSPVPPHLLEILAKRPAHP